MSVTGVGKRSPSSHLEPASQPATQPALEPASQSFLKGPVIWQNPVGGDRGGLGLAAVSPQTLEKIRYSYTTLKAN